MRISDWSSDVCSSDLPPDVIRALYDESRRVLSPGGLMFHSVNCGDHYAYVDGRINQLNYLQYPDRAWAFWNNRLLYQNRLRAHRSIGRASGRERVGQYG